MNGFIKERTFNPRSLMGVICPGTMHSGPAASTIASVPKPCPIGSGCCRIPIQNPKDSKWNENPQQIIKQFTDTNIQSP